MAGDDGCENEEVGWTQLGAWFGRVQSNMC